MVDFSFQSCIFFSLSISILTTPSNPNPSGLAFLRTFNGSNPSGPFLLVYHSAPCLMWECSLSGAKWEIGVRGIGRVYGILRTKAAWSLSKQILVPSSQSMALSQFVNLPGLHTKLRHLFHLQKSNSQFYIWPSLIKIFHKWCRYAQLIRCITGIDFIVSVLRKAMTKKKTLKSIEGVMVNSMNCSTLEKSAEWFSAM